MISYGDSVSRDLKKRKLPKEIFGLFHHAFVALETTGDLNLFDIKRLKANENRAYFRMRKGKYRALFFIEKGDYFIFEIKKRSEVYEQWP